MDRTSGYSLIEVLVMLAITALLTTVVLETVRASASNGIRIEQAARQATQDYLDIAVIRRAVEGSRSDYIDSDHAFSGNSESFRSLTATAIVSQIPNLQPYSLRLVDENGGVSLIYEDTAGAYTAAHWPGSQGSFTYYGNISDFSQREILRASFFDTQDRQWVDQWPPQSSTNRTERFFMPLPVAVKITIQNNDGGDALVFYLPSNTRPPTRLEDVF